MALHTLWAIPGTAVRARGFPKNVHYVPAGRRKGVSGKIKRWQKSKKKKKKIKKRLFRKYTDTRACLVQLPPPPLSLSLPPSLHPPPPPPHTHTSTRSPPLAHTRTCSLTHTRARAHTRTHARTHCKRRTRKKKKGNNEDKHTTKKTASRVSEARLQKGSTESCQVYVRPMTPAGSATKSLLQPTGQHQQTSILSV